MKKNSLIWLLCIFSFISCNNLYDDSTKDKSSYMKVDYSSYIKDNEIIFPKNTNAIYIFNCLFDTYNGYGEYTCIGTYEHTETAVLNGKTYSDTISYDIEKINIYPNITSGSSSFIVDFITKENKIITLAYQWQYKLENIWKNDKLDGKIILKSPKK